MVKGACLPGLIDLYFHGCIGADFVMDPGKPWKNHAYEASAGVTTIAPATMTPTTELNRFRKVSIRRILHRERILNQHGSGLFISLANGLRRYPTRSAPPGRLLILHFEFRSSSVVSGYSCRRDRCNTYRSLICTDFFSSFPGSTMKSARISCNVQIDETQQGTPPSITAPKHLLHRSSKQFSSMQVSRLKVTIFGIFPLNILNDHNTLL